MLLARPTHWSVLFPGPNFLLSTNSNAVIIMHQIFSGHRGQNAFKVELLLFLVILPYVSHTAFFSNVNSL